MDADLKTAERTAFRAVTDDGLWDVLLASWLALFALGPALSERVGDYWSSAVFLPVWVGLYLAIRFVRERVLVPRVGMVEFGPLRKKRLRRVGRALVAVNTVALLLGIVAFVVAERGAGGPWAFPLAFSITLLVMLSLVAYAGDVPRYFLYGLLVAAAPLIGEWMFRRGLATHHGFPLVFGVLAVLIAATGLARFVLRVRNRPPVDEGGAGIGADV